MQCEAGNGENKSAFVEATTGQLDRGVCNTHIPVIPDLHLV